MIVSITGFMGCGKSSVGRRLSELLCCRFMDLDDVIVEREGRSIPEIFAEDGEGEFRRMEKEALEDVLETSETSQCAPLAPSQLALGPSPYPGVGKCQLRTSASSPQDNQKHPSEDKPRMILALGGGAVMQEECEEMVHSETLCIYLRASVETLVERLTGEADGRPLMAGADSGKSSQTAGTSCGPSVMSSEVETSALGQRILKLMAARSETYERVAHIIIDTDGKSINEVAEEIVSAACHYTAS